MSKRSDRKWAAKEQRADAIREDGQGYRKTGGQVGLFGKMIGQTLEPIGQSQAEKNRAAMAKDREAKAAASQETAKKAAEYGAKHPNSAGGRDTSGFQRGAEQVPHTHEGHTAAAEKARSERNYGLAKEHDEAAEKLRQKSVGEAHLEAASIHEKAAKSFRKLEASKGSGVRLSFAGAAADHEKEAAEHKAAAAEAASKAGGEWDESKHPRDENGKFA